MTDFSLAFFSLVQAITEFIPVSSSGHLTLAQDLFGLLPSLGLNVFLNTATLISVLVYFWPKLKALLAWVPYVILASIPAGLAGIFLNDYFESLFASTTSLKYTFLLTSLLLLSTRFFKLGHLPLNWRRAVIIGLFQAVAILPGVSRSGATIVAGLLVGLSPRDAFKFSFALFIPASFGAILLEAGSFTALGLTSFQVVFSFLGTALVGLLALRLLENLVTSRRLWLFGLYTFILSLFLFLT